MNPNQAIVLYIVVGLVAFSFLYRRREALAHSVRGIVVAILCGAAAFLLLWKGCLSPVAAYFAALVVVFFVRRTQPRRSRHVSAYAKRQAIAKWEKETGETFNRRIHELDHVLPHSRGGGNAEDNIKVLTRKQNRSKGARRNWRDDE